MPKKAAGLDFEVERRNSEGYLLVSKKEEIIIRIKDPNDEDHAAEVLAFLEKHITAITSDPEREPPPMMIG